MISEDASLKTLAASRIARANRVHAISYNPSAVKDPNYLICEQCGFILRLFGVGESDRVDLARTAKGRQIVLVQEEGASKIPALDLMQSMMRRLPVDGYEVINAENKEVYRDGFFSMKLVEVYRSPVLHCVENLPEFPMLLKIQDLDFTGARLLAISNSALQGNSCKEILRNTRVRLKMER